MEQLPVIFAVDRNGIVGSDGETHQGIFTNSFLGHVPGLTVMEPRDAKELKMMLSYAVCLEKPCAICYPRGKVQECGIEQHAMVEQGKAEVLCEDGTDCVLMALGTMVSVACKVKDKLAAKGISASVLNMRFVSPPDKEAIADWGNRAKLVVTFEENVKRGGFGEMVSEVLYECCSKMPKYLSVALPDEFLPQGSVSELRKQTGIDVDSITERILEIF